MHAGVRQVGMLAGHMRQDLQDELHALLHGLLLRLHLRGRLLRVVPGHGHPGAWRHHAQHDPHELLLLRH